MPASEGRVYLVGAGPGDPGLLTARALELIAQADVILYDRLIPRRALEGAGNATIVAYVGKREGRAELAQEEIERLLVEHARAGRRVVRLKGGDPFVFGRGGEEARALREAGVAFEIVPGVTAGVAVPAYAGIPVTYRGLASAVAFVTGHEDPGKDGEAIDWEALARFPGTLVFYMGARRLAAIAAALMAAGRPGDEPAAVVERGTLPEQRSVAATLATIADAAARAQLRPPSIIVVGAVAALAEDLRWRAEPPLRGLRVAVTRARAQTSELASRLTELGADVVEAPVIAIRPLPGPAPSFEAYDLLCFTSVNGVEELFSRLQRDGRDGARELATTRIAAIGPATARAARDRGLVVDVTAEQSLAEGLAHGLAQTGVPVRRALIARGAEGRDVLVNSLRAAGAEVDVLALYETVAEPLAPEALAAALNADYITFTSSSTVRFLAAAAGGTLRPAAASRIVSIGPLTSATLREHGLEPHVQASRHDVDGIVEALLADAGGSITDAIPERTADAIPERTDDAIPERTDDAIPERTAAAAGGAAERPPDSH